MTRLTRFIALPTQPANVAKAREFVATFLAEAGIPSRDAFQVLVGATEAITNACRHGARPEGGGQMRIGCAADGRDVQIIVADDGPGFMLEENRLHEPPDPNAIGGRGLFLMNQSVDDLNVVSGPLGTQITLRFRLTPSNGGLVSTG
jgi:serine/threonine-protein kinase RsbW